MEKINLSLFGEGPSKYEKKLKALEDAVEDDRLKPIDFIGKRYYTLEYIQKANEELSDKLKTENSEYDESAHLAEWEFTYVLNHEEALPGCRARLASEYDDHKNAIDIVCNLKDENGNSQVFGVDVATATSEHAVKEKFARGDHPRGQVPAGCSFIKFYEDGDYVACMKGVPRFIVGASPLFNGQQKYFDNFNLEEDGTVSHSPDPDLRFNILSSLFVQSTTLIKELSNNPSGEEQTCERAISTCRAVRIAAKRGLVRLLGAKDEKDFQKKLQEKIEEAKHIEVNGHPDYCYTHIINESRRRFILANRKYMA